MYFVGSPANSRPNVFENILQPSRGSRDSSEIQMELHYHSTKESVIFTCFLNNMRVMGVLDWLLPCKDFLTSSAQNPFEQGKKFDATCQNQAFVTIWHKLSFRYFHRKIRNFHAN